MQATGKINFGIMPVFSIQWLDHLLFLFIQIARAQF